MVRGPSPIRVPRVASEDDLCRLWASGEVPPDALVTTAGQHLQVVYPGRRNGTGGPDFQGAMLVDGTGHLHSGDVEAHLWSRDWIAHGHRADPAYDGVMLHVVLVDDGEPCLRSDGAPVPVLALAPVLGVPLALVAAVAPSALTSCRVAPHLDTPAVRDIVRAAGRRRLEGKAAQLEAQIAVLGSEQALFAALLDAAGYSRNRRPCALLAERVPVERLMALLGARDAASALDLATAVLLGLAGLLPSGASPAVLAAWTRYSDLWPLPPLHTDEWVRAGVRPANRPEVRLRGIAALLTRHAHGPGTLAAGLLAPVEGGDVEGLLAALEVPGPSAAPPPGRPPDMSSSTVSTIHSDADGAAMFASSEGRYSPATPRASTPPIGRARAVEMAVNVVVPFALAVRVTRGGDTDTRAIWATATALPGGEDAEPVRRMSALLAASGHRLTRPAPGALEVQGLLHLHHTFCSVGACWECPLAQATGSPPTDAHTPGPG